MTRDQARGPYAEAIDYITSLVRADPTPDTVRESLGLAPIRGLLGSLGDPHAALGCIHIAGSKGKGTTALLCERILRAGGIRTGTYTSPHLVSWTERIRIDGEPVSQAAFAEAIFAARRAAATGAGPAPSFFDVLTAAALRAFAGHQVDVAILETGLGGRLDATNAVDTPLATCITTIELEHTDRLGSSLPAIAAEKAGIIKPGVPLVLGRLDEAPRAVVLRRAAERDAPVWSLAERARLRRDGATGWRISIDLDSGPQTLSIDHPSAALADDAALAVATVAASDLLARDPLARALGALGNCQVPGRLDVLGERPLRVVDGAHTTESVRNLLELLDALAPPHLELVVSVTKGKDPARLLAPLIARADAVHVTSAEPSRSMPAAALAEALAGVLSEALAQTGARPRVHVVDDPRAALARALAATPADGALCATGSLYLAGVALEVLPRD